MQNYVKIADILNQSSPESLASIHKREKGG